MKFTIVVTDDRMRDIDLSFRTYNSVDKSAYVLIDETGRNRGSVKKRKDNKWVCDFRMIPGGFFKLGIAKTRKDAVKLAVNYYNMYKINRVCTSCKEVSGTELDLKAGSPFCKACIDVVSVNKF
jgi:hypothetical protein